MPSYIFEIFRFSNLFHISPSMTHIYNAVFYCLPNYIKYSFSRCSDQTTLSLAKVEPVITGLRDITQKVIFVFLFLCVDDLRELSKQQKVDCYHSRLQSRDFHSAGAYYVTSTTGKVYLSFCPHSAPLRDTVEYH